MHAAELALTRAAARGDVSAVAEIEQAHRATIGATCRRFQSQAHSVDDLRQVLRERLFAGAVPKIGEYAGQGHLDRLTELAATRRSSISASAKIARASCRSATAASRRCGPGGSRLRLIR
jgi:hypothetical protein